MLHALERLLEDGRSLSAVTIDELTSTAGIARSTFYLNYRDKADLVARLMRRVTEEIVTASGVWFQRPAEARRADLAEALHGIVTVYCRHRAVMTAVMDTAASDATLSEVFDDMVGRLRRRSRQAVAAVRSAGRARAGATPQVADTLTWAVLNACHTQLRSGSARDARRLADTLTHICWHAIFAEAIASEPEHAA